MDVPPQVTLPESFYEQRIDVAAGNATLAPLVRSPQAATQSPPNKLGVCSEYRANDSHSVRPIFAAEFYINEFKRGPNVLVKENGQINFRLDTTISIAKVPSHGNLELFRPDADDIGKYDYLYFPDKDYVGEDNFQFDVAVDGKTLRVYYQVKVYAEDENPNYVGFCDWEKYYWKISQSDSPNLGAVDVAFSQGSLSYPR